jgi:hypothetical protein
MSTSIDGRNAVGSGAPSINSGIDGAVSTGKAHGTESAYDETATEGLKVADKIGKLQALGALCTDPGSTSPVETANHGMCICLWPYHVPLASEDHVYGACCPCSTARSVI